MRLTLVLIAGCCTLLSCNNSQPVVKTATSQDTTTATKETKQAPSEFADPKYAEIGKKAIAQMSSGDIDGWASGFADNAVYRWSSGDSLSGKAAISKYWKDRRTKVIDSISFANDIWLPLKVNQSQKGPDVPGNWLLSWYQVNVKYKNGAKLVFWTHTDYHFNSDDKIDIAIQYIGRAPINKALGIK